MWLNEAILWIVKTRKHYKVVYKCGHIANQCACTGANTKAITRKLSTLCPTCQLHARSKSRGRGKGKSK